MERHGTRGGDGSWHIALELYPEVGQKPTINALEVFSRYVMSG
jgi:hypothetical protein